MMFCGEEFGGRGSKDWDLRSNRGWRGEDERSFVPFFFPPTNGSFKDRYISWRVGDFIKSKNQNLSKI